MLASYSRYHWCQLSRPWWHRCPSRWGHRCPLRRLTWWATGWRWKKQVCNRRQSTMLSQKYPRRDSHHPFSSRAKPLYRHEDDHLPREQTRTQRAREEIRQVRISSGECVGVSFFGRSCPPPTSSIGPEDLISRDTALDPGWAHGIDNACGWYSEDRPRGLT